MCGIWAYLKGSAPKSALHDGAGSYGIDAQARDFFQLTHRGPDHSHFENVARAGLTLGFHRLAIVDTSFKGNQPFIKEDELRTVILLCNGEIYNYKELAEEFLLSRSEATNDCLVLLEIYWKLRKEGCVEDFIPLVQERVKGEYAFVILELDALKRLESIVACRDPVGVRPLYVSTGASVAEGKGLLFTSELKGALLYPGDMREFPPGHLYRYHVDSLGEIAVEDHVLTRRLYASGLVDPSDVSDVHLKKGVDGDVKLVVGGMESKWLSSVRQATMASVKRRLAADRPLAFLLSGGIDSSLVAACSARLLGKPIRTFCCGITEDGVKVGRDLEYAREVAEWLGSEHTEVLFTKEEALACIPDVIRTVESWDTTTVRASVGQYLVCRWIGQNTDCKVVMVGEGPDEVCSSYLFNWYAPSGEALDQSARDYVRRIHLYDARRADRCVARWGLEARVPFLDPEFIQTYWSIPGKERMPKARGAEKWWLREAFKGTGLLPERVRLRMKDAFSDSISGQVSWTEMIQAWVADKVSEEEMVGAGSTFPLPVGGVPASKEAYYYRKVFCSVFGEARQTVLPGYWQPRWNAEGKEVVGYVDPSARTLGVYRALEKPVDVCE